jgi:hypothetical protein
MAQFSFFKKYGASQMILRCLFVFPDECVTSTSSKYANLYGRMALEKRFMCIGLHHKTLIVSLALLFKESLKCFKSTYITSKSIKSNRY